MLLDGETQRICLGLVYSSRKTERQFTLPTSQPPFNPIYSHQQGPQGPTWSLMPFESVLRVHIVSFIPKSFCHTESTYPRRFCGVAG